MLRLLRNFLSKESRIVILMSGVWFLILFGLSLLKYVTLQLKFLDEGIYYYVGNNIALNGSFMEYAIDFGHFLGIHMDPFIAVYALFFKISSHPLMLHFVYNAIMASGAWAAYLIARQVFKEKEAVRQRLLVPFAYLTFLPLLFATLYDYNMVRIAPPLMLFFLYFAVVKKEFLKSLVFIVLLASIRETMPLAIVGTAFYLCFIEKERIKGLLTLLSAVLLLVLTFALLMPYFREHYPNQFFTINDGGGLTYFNTYYPYLRSDSIPGVLIKFFTSPLAVLKAFFMTPPEKWLMVFGFFAFLLFIPLLSLRFLLISLFSLVVYYLAVTPSIFYYYSQYLSEIYPPLFLSFAFGLKVFLGRNYHSRIMIFLRKHFFLFACTVLSLFFVFSVIFFTVRYLRPYFKHKDTIEVILSDPLQLKQQKDIAIYLHNRLYPYYGFKTDMAFIDRYEIAHPFHLKKGTSRKFYIVNIQEEDYGSQQMEFFNRILPKARADGFKKVYEYKNFTIYMKEIKGP